MIATHYAVAPEGYTQLATGAGVLHTAFTDDKVEIFDGVETTANLIYAGQLGGEALDVVFAEGLYVKVEAGNRAFFYFA